MAERNFVLGQYTPSWTGAQRRTIGGKLAELVSIKDFYASGDSDDLNAFNRLGDYLRSVAMTSHVTVDLPTDAYECAGRVMWTNICNVTINANGSTLKNTQGFYNGGDSKGGNNYTIFIGGLDPWSTIGSRTADTDITDYSRHNGDEIDTASPGDTTLTFKSAGAYTGYTAGDTVMIYSRAFWNAGYPPLCGHFEWRKVVTATDNQIVVDAPLHMRHRDDYGDLAWDVDIGKARVINWTGRYCPDYVEINDFQCLGKNPASAYTADNGLVIFTGARRYSIKNCKWKYFWPGPSELFEADSCHFEESEVDKFVRRVVTRDTTILKVADGGTGIAEWHADRCKFYQVQAQRAYRHVWRDCELGFSATDAQAYLNPYYFGYPLAGVTLERCTITTPSTSHATLGYRNGLNIGLGTATTLFGSSNTITSSGGLTTQVTIAGASAEVGDDRLWPGQRFVAEEATAGHVLGRVVSSRADGSDLDVDVVTTGTMKASSSAYPADFMGIYNLVGNEVITEQTGGFKGIQNFQVLEMTKDYARVVFTPDIYNSKFTETVYLAFLLEEYAVNVIVPYTGADSTLVWRLTTTERTVSSTGSSRNIDVNVKTAGRRVYMPGVVTGNVTGDSSTGIAVGTFQTLISWACAPTERAAGTPDATKMPHLTIEMKLRLLPERLFPEMP